MRSLRLDLALINFQSPHHQEKIVRNILFSSLVIAILVFGYVFSLLSRTTPWADEWQMVLYKQLPFSEFVSWLFTQHNDHRIVIQRLIQQSILYFYGYDFRVLTLVNTLMMIVSAYLMLKIFRLYRGSSALVDLAVIASLCAVGSNAVYWSSTFAFPATNLGVITLGYAWTLRLRQGHSRRYAFYAFVALVSGPLISGGGLVASTALVLFLGILRFARRDCPQPVGKFGLIVAGLVCLISWHYFVPSGATGFRADRILGLTIGMGGGSLFLSQWPHEYIKDIFVTGAIVVTALVLTNRLFRATPMSVFEVPVTAIFFAISCVTLSVIIGRSANAAWFPELKNHYGIVTAPLVPIVVLIFNQMKYLRTLTIIILLLTFLSYSSSFASVTRYLEYSRSTNLNALQQIIQSNDLEKTLATNWLDFWYRDDDRSLIPSIAIKARYLQEFGGRWYKRDG